jgi:hypothetical protein
MVGMNPQRTHGAINVRPLLVRHVLALAVVVVIFAVLNSIPVHTLRPRGDLVKYKGGLYLAEPMLLATWLFLSPFSFRRQLVTFGIVATLWLATGLWGYYNSLQHHLSGSRPDDILIPFLIEGCFAASTVVATYFMRRVRGLRLVPRGWHEPIPAGQPLRFSLLRLFGVTTAIGAVLALQVFREPFGAAVMSSLIGCMALLPFLPALTLILGSRFRRRTIAIDFAVLVAIPLVLWALATNNIIPYDSDLTAIVAVWAVACVGTFALLRLCGFRLVAGGHQVILQQCSEVAS